MSKKRKEKNRVRQENISKNWKKSREIKKK